MGKSPSGLFRVVSLLFFALSVKAQAADDVLIHKDNHEKLAPFVLVDDSTSEVDATELEHSLIQVRSFLVQERRYVRYQQYYKGIEVQGRALVGHYGKAKEGVGAWDHSEGLFHGKITRGIDLTIKKEQLTDSFRRSMGAKAQKAFKRSFGDTDSVSDLDIQPLVWVDQGAAKLAYRVNFRVQSESGPGHWPHYLLAAEDGAVIRYWNNMQGLHADEGPGGNGKTGYYEFGPDGILPFSVTEQDGECFLANQLVRVISLNQTWTLPPDAQAVSWSCGENTGKSVNGAWAPANDAYVFASLVVSMFQNWYGMPVLAQANGDPKPVTVLVNVGRSYQNAFWDGQWLGFGDGAASYHPLVSVAIVAHELAHAFTSQHSGLVYADQSGAINEAFSDMAAIAAEFYLQQYDPEAYGTIMDTSDIDWHIGDRIAKGRFALRSMSAPEAYSSAACYTRISGCSRSWNDVLTAARQIQANSRQSYIVHKGSGVMNRAFVHIVEALEGDVRQAFSLMVRANMFYWTAGARFSEAACGVKQAAEVEGVSLEIVSQAFEKVGVTPDC
ncbi:MAG: M4 family metallopeptidase [Kistimonas sp.]|nr:M4 family metallopeptidase [Kistimonas sp.]